MKLAISSLCCPDQDLAVIIDHARQHGFEGVDLSVSPAPASPARNHGWLANPQGVRQQMQAAGLEFACLSASAGLDERDPDSLTRSIAALGGNLALARTLGCPCVRVRASGTNGSQSGSLAGERREAKLARVSIAVRALVPQAVRQGVGILVENGGDFADSASVWHILEAAGSPLVRSSWNPWLARKVPERCTTAIPRLGSKIAMVRIVAGGLPEATDSAPGPVAGEGEVDVPRLIQLLKGINYRGYLVLDPTSLPRPATPGAVVPADAASPCSQERLAAIVAYLRKLLEEKPVVLTAYKGDKFRPRQGSEFTAGR
jgi:sugar phosphate isomerase/epimerase